VVDVLLGGGMETELSLIIQTQMLLSGKEIYMPKKIKDEKNFLGKTVYSNPDAVKW
jgi:hypothetical protein